MRGATNAMARRLEETSEVLDLIGGLSGKVSINKKNGICTITCRGASTTGSLTDVSVTFEDVPVPMGGYVQRPLTYGNTVIGVVYIYTTYNNQLHATVYGAQSYVSFTLTYAIDE